MLRTVGCRGWASIRNCTSDSGVVRNSSWEGRLEAAVVRSSRDLLGLGFGGSSGQQARTFDGGFGSNFFFQGAGKEAVQRWNGVLSNGSFSKLGEASGPWQVDHVRRFIQLRTNLEVADNSGARRVQCIKVMKGSNAAQIGDTIMASVKDAQPRGKVKKGEVVTCVVVRAATHKLRRDGSEIKFDKNAVVLVNKQGEPIGTRIFGPVPHELRRRKLVKILTLAEHVA